jgi:hypothetical protein
MIATFSYGPRQIGKSTIIAEKYLEDPTNVGVICHHDKSSFHFSNLLIDKGFKLKTKTAPNVYDSFHSDLLRGTKCKIFYIDELDYFKNPLDVIYKLPNTVEEIHVFTSPAYQRDMTMFLLAKEALNTQVGVFEMIQSLLPEESKEKEEYILKLNKMLDDPLVRSNEIIQLKTPEWWHRDTPEIKEMLNERYYDTEILGKIFKLK